MDFRIIVIPLVGGLIGYVTNSIAITMLFRPHRPIYIRGHRLPFTPGIIPKEKDRLARSMAGLINDQLLNSEVLQSALLSPEVTGRLEEAVDGLIDRYRQSDKTLRQELESLGRPERSGALAVTETVSQVSGLIAGQLEGFGQGEAIAQSALHELRGHYSQEGAFRGLLSRVLDDNLVDRAADQLGGYIDRLVSQNGPGLVEDFISRQADNILDMPVSQVLASYESELPRFREGLMGAYRELVSSSLEPALKSLDLARIIEERIGAFSTEEMERLIKSVIHRELRLIVWLGAILGFVMGFAGLLFL